jgi:Gas vesicle synthesis protein GvpL/GvpF
MSRLVYGVVGADGTAVLGTGIDDRPLRSVREGLLMAIVTDHDGPGPDSDATTIDAYERTVRTLMESRAILPSPFGRVLEDDDDVRAMLRRRRRALLARLDRVHGAVELGLSARWLGASDTCRDPRMETGVAYLRNRLEMRESARRLANELDPLTALARSISRALSTRRDLPVLDAYLVDRGRVKEFVALVAELGDRLEGVELVCTGPCPPYSFADGGVLRSTR